MRATIRLDDALLQRAKAAAAKSGQSLSEFVADALVFALSRPPRTPAEGVKLPTAGDGGVQPGVNLDSSTRLLDLMEDLTDERTR